MRLLLKLILIINGLVLYILSMTLLVVRDQPARTSYLLAFSCFHDYNPEICLMNSDGSSFRRITNGSPNQNAFCCVTWPPDMKIFSNHLFGNRNPAWSPAISLSWRDWEELVLPIVLVGIGIMLPYRVT